MGNITELLRSLALLFVLAVAASDAVTWQKRVRPFPWLQSNETGPDPTDAPVPQFLRPTKRRYSNYQQTEIVPDFTITTTDGTPTTTTKTRKGYWFDSARKRPPTNKNNFKTKIRTTPSTDTDDLDKRTASSVSYMDADGGIAMDMQLTSELNFDSSTTESTDQGTQGLVTDGTEEAYLSNAETEGPPDVNQQRIVTDFESATPSIVTNNVKTTGAGRYEVPKFPGFTANPPTVPPTTSVSTTEAPFARLQTTQVPQVSLNTIKSPGKSKSSSIKQPTTDGMGMPTGPKDKGYVLWSYKQGNQSSGFMYSNMNGQAKWTVQNKDDSYTVESGKDGNTSMEIPNVEIPNEVPPALFRLTVRNTSRSTGEVRAVRLQIARRPTRTRTPDAGTQPVTSEEVSTAIFGSRMPEMDTVAPTDVSQMDLDVPIAGGMSDMMKTPIAISQQTEKISSAEVMPMPQVQDRNTDDQFDTILNPSKMSGQMPFMQQRQVDVTETAVTTEGTEATDTSAPTTEEIEVPDKTAKNGRKETTTATSVVSPKAKGAAAVAGKTTTTTTKSAPLTSSLPVYMDGRPNSGGPVFMNDGSPGSKKWVVVGDGGPDGWMLLGEDGMLEWKIEYVNGKWKIIDARALDVIKRNNLLVKFGVGGAKNKPASTGNRYYSPQITPPIRKVTNRPVQPYRQQQYFNPHSDRSYILYDLHGNTGSRGYSANPWAQHDDNVDVPGDWDYSRSDEDYSDFYHGLDYGDESSKVVVVPQQELSSILGKQVGSSGLSVFNKTFGKHKLFNGTADTLAKEVPPKGGKAAPRVSGYALKAPVKHVSGKITYGNTEQDAIELFKSLIADNAGFQLSGDVLFRGNGQTPTKNFPAAKTDTGELGFGKTQILDYRTTDLHPPAVQNFPQKSVSYSKGEKTSESLRYHHLVLPGEQPKLSDNNEQSTSNVPKKKEVLPKMSISQKNPDITISRSDSFDEQNKKPNSRTKIFQTEQSGVPAQTVRWSQPIPSNNDDTDTNGQSRWRISGPDLRIEKQGLRGYQHYIQHQPSQPIPESSSSEDIKQQTRKSTAPQTLKNRQEPSKLLAQASSNSDQQVGALSRRGNHQQGQRDSLPFKILGTNQDIYKVGSSRTDNGNKKTTPEPSSKPSRTNNEQNTQQKRKKQVIFIDYSREEDANGRSSANAPRDVEIVIKNSRPRVENPFYT